jgi:hypothetical protein
LYFKKQVPERFLKNITYPKDNSKIIISFYINKENIPFDVTTNSARNKELSMRLITAFEEYPLQNLNINFKTEKKYTFQIISKLDDTNVINQNPEINEISAPNCSECSDLDFYKDIENCIKKKIENYFYNTIDYSLAKNMPTEDDTMLLGIELFINTLGVLKLKKLKSPSVFKEHIETIIDDFNEKLTPKMINDRPKNYNYYFFQILKKGKKPKNKELNIYFDSIFKPTTSNYFAIYLKDNLTDKDVKNANLNRLKNRISLYFELDKKGKPFEITTTSRSKKLENKIITLFKNFDFEKLNFVEKNRFNRYFTSIIIFENEKNIIKTNSIIGYNRGALFIGCENSKNVKAARACFSRQVQVYFSKKFRTRIMNTLGLSTGRKRIFIGFKVDKTGRITDITCRAPHKKIKQEVIRVMKKLPEVKPAVFGRKTVNIKYSIPFTLIVE